ncbi:MAG TPA: hypothetical protein VH333_17065 [Pseudonocardiaceae bacterium]|nr:hypothetical protein [Pseudonocardiaceae bacterium]
MAESSDRIALPIRVHDFLLACAGRVDDDALTDARELLAVAELDRAVDLLTASLVAGRIPMSADERDELRDLVDAVRSSPALVDRVIVNDDAVPPRHRFTTGVMDDPAPDGGVLEAVGRVVEVLPDIRALSCVWRATPAGAPAGPVPQRMVLVEVGPDGFPPSTSYRVEQALRRAGIRAAVEVIQAGTEVTDYHADALAVARRVSLRQAAARGHEADGEAGSSLFADSPTPRSVTSTRRRYSAGAHAEKRSTVDASGGRWQPRIASDEPAADQEGDSAAVRPIHAEPEQPTAPPVLAPVELPPATADPDADLSSRERELLRQLHEELAKREGEEPTEDPAPAPAPSPGTNWHASQSGHFTPTEFGGQGWHDGAADQTAVNGIPPYGSAPN